MNRLICLTSVLAVAAVSGALTGCDGGASAVAVRDVRAEQSRPARSEAFADAGPMSRSSAQDSGPSSTLDPRDQPIPKLDGRPIWTANSRHTAEENAVRQFERNGEDFGVHSMEDYARKARQFVENPPGTAQTLKRENGDVLIYDPNSNVFAVASSAGVPRTMFKPRDGASYWAEQQDRQSERRTASGSRARSDSNRDG
jgi:pyocin large subunit-like protein